ncbi:hypothetical protein F5146DRAFT_720430 [Armillaria mellea]|nr:hypothetical protein F5146DRAFT_720430 [Armillaria mellea]
MWNIGAAGRRLLRISVNRRKRSQEACAFCAYNGSCDNHLLKIVPQHAVAAGIGLSGGFGTANVIDETHQKDIKGVEVKTIKRSLATVIVKPKAGANGTLRALHFSVVSGGKGPKRDAKDFRRGHEKNKIRSRRSKVIGILEKSVRCFSLRTKTEDEEKESKVQKAQLNPETQEKKRRSRPQRLKPPDRLVLMSIAQNFITRVPLYKTQVLGK